MIIDAHSHWLPEEIITNAHFFSRSWGDIEAQLRVMDEAGIDAAVLSYPTSDAYTKIGGHAEVARIFNNNVGQIIKRYPKRFIAAMALPVGHSQAMLYEISRTTQEYGFKAISLASSYDGVYLDHESFLPVYKEAQARNLPIFVHSQIVSPIGYERLQDPLLTPVIEYVFDTTVAIGSLLMADVLRDYPKLTFVFAYFGGTVCHLANRFDATYQMLRGINFVKDLRAAPTQYLKNIYVDTSGDTTKTNYLAALELLGPHHILWGSDWPAKKDVAAGMQAVKDLGLGDTTTGDIFGLNAERILKGA